ncbi:hypothetical protein BpHYR1_046973 [Brachionus plicatilis]|uniref:Uncharacterized protein n=1 Tax=Brachionus plicatilis TaxID=10195 RepID=A0A3M7SDQ5_BRAPC|nr:hypothetical protein BpHYR1_046973 [Brachionus plicatilis]
MGQLGHPARPSYYYINICESRNLFISLPQLFLDFSFPHWNSQKRVEEQNAYESVLICTFFGSSRLGELWFINYWNNPCSQIKNLNLGGVVILVLRIRHSIQ